MIRTWVADIRPLLDETCYQEYYEHMPKFRQKKADALKLVQGKAQSIGVWYLYEQMKKEYGIQKDAEHIIFHIRENMCCVLFMRERIRRFVWDAILRRSGSAT